MTRTLVPAVAAVAAVATLALAGTAPSASAATPHIAKFVASLRLEDVDRWEEPRQQASSESCQGTAWHEGSGSEVRTLRTTPMRIRVLPAGPGAATFAYGPFHKPAPGLKGTTKIVREMSIRDWVEPGQCTSGPLAPPKVSEDTCAERPMRSTATLVVTGGRLHPVLQINDLGGLVLLCDHLPTDGGSEVFTRSAARLPVSRLFDRDREFVVISGRATIRSTHTHPLRGTRSRELKWTLRMRRAT